MSRGAALTLFGGWMFHRCRANSAHVRQSLPDYGLGFQVKILEPFEVFPSALGSGAGHLMMRSTLRI